MGEVLENMIKALEDRMDSGVLHDLNSTRLQVLIGEEFIRHAVNMPDESGVIAVVESAMQKYFQKGMEVETAPQTEPGEMETPPVQAEVRQEQPRQEPSTVAAPTQKQEGSAELKFSLHVKKNSDNYQALVNGVPLLFSPKPLRDAMDSFLSEQLPLEESSGVIRKIVSENSETMLSDILKRSLGNQEKTTFQVIRLGMVIFRLLGFGETQISANNVGWIISLMGKRKSDRNFFPGYIDGVLKVALGRFYKRYTMTFDEEKFAVSVKLKAA